MHKATRLEIEGLHPLPPLILHPFADSSASVKRLEAARASAALIRGGKATADAFEKLEQQMLEGRYAEFRMLFYVGKDVCRWLEQCVDYCDRRDEAAAHRLPQQSFAQLLIEQTPVEVSSKLRAWGVVDYPKIFARSIGIRLQFRELPCADMLQQEYLRHYFRYADYAHASWRDMQAWPVLPQTSFPFELYASGEYARRLEEEWEEK
jgi:hypothetical protein